jgi:signal transduction histidine kinase/CheY-like chemotaxis protein
LGHGGEIIVIMGDEVRTLPFRKQSGYCDIFLGRLIMLALSPCLHQFLDCVPVAQSTILPRAALEVMMRAGSDRLVLLDDQQRPVGCVRLASLAHCFMADSPVPLSSPKLDLDALPAIAPEIPPDLITPLIAVSADLPLAQFLGQYSGSQDKHYAIVNEHRSFLGLLSDLQVLEFLATQMPLLTTSADGQVVQPPAAALPLDPLLELLKRLPLPLMLQTSSGHVLAQTTLWTQQAEQLHDATAVHQEASYVLEGLAGIDPKSAALLNDLAAEGLIPTVCQLGTTPNTFTCICPLKTGQEQILQFIRIPLGALRWTLAEGVVRSPTADGNRDPNAQWWNLPAQDWPPPFQLAELLPASAPSEPPSRLRDQDESASETPESGLGDPPETLWLVLAQDVTAQQQLARELTAKNADLIQLNRLKDEFLACISHELRTPLTAVLGLSTLLKDQTLGHLNQRQVHYAQLIYQSGRHLMTVVNDILDLTRMETGQLELVPEPVNIQVVCDRAIDQAKQLRLLDGKQAAESDDVHIPAVTLDIESGLEFLVADELRLRQMLVHLCSNAFKFTETDQPVGLNVNRWGGWIAFTVWDTGLGIPADKQHLIFQKFKQLENPLTRRFEGTGLGLAITQRLARLHGGDVTFISKEGEGSQFTILLPPTPPDKSPRPSNEVDVTAVIPGAAVAPSAATPPEDRPPLYGQTTHRDRYSRPPETMPPTGSALLNRNRLVLVVEAAPQFVETISEQLSNLGYRVVIARSGTEALEKARRLQPCLIFLNPVLPLLSGWDVLTLLKSSPTTHKIPVVITTTQVDAEHASSGPADRVISLPIQEKILHQTLRQLLLESDAPPPPPPTGKLTVLHLNCGSYNQGAQHNQTLVEDLNQLLHSHHYRVLEADDLEQAELLARVWKPKVVMLSGTAAAWDIYFQQFSQYTFLASLPLVTLDPETTQAANQVSGLLVFPCLAPLPPQLFGENLQAPAALLQVIQVAAGHSWQPSLLAVDLAALPGRSLGTPHRATPPLDTLGSLPKESEWLQALTQYLGTAGFRALIGRSWPEVWQQLETQSVNLLLIGWTATTLDDTLLERLAALQDLRPCPAILVLDHRHHDGATTAVLPLPPALRNLATKILPPSISMSDLLIQIHQIMR